MYGAHGENRQRRNGRIGGSCACRTTVLWQTGSSRFVVMGSVASLT